LAALSQSDPRLAQVVELRYFVGLKEAEIASLMSLSLGTVKRVWRKARMLLSAALSQ
jgi:DNA-directed RNA polymerase specialized sigma24 family protein